MIWLGIALSCLGLVGSASWSSWSAYERAAEDAATNTQNLVRILKQHTERTFESVDMLLKVVARELGPDSADPVKRSWATEGMAYLTQDVPHVMALRLLDGHTAQPLFEFVSTRAVGDAADRDAVAAHANARYLGLHISKPVRDPVSGSWHVGVSRRITGREGTPGLVVIAHVTLDYFQEFYDGVAVGDQGAIILIRSDGTTLARRPFNAANVGRSIAQSKLFREELPRANAGTFQTVAVNDGVARIYSYEKLEELPLVIAVGIADQQIVATWVADIKDDVAMALAASLIFLVIGMLLSREVRRRDSAEFALSDSEERLRLALDAGRMFAWELDPATGFVTRSENSKDIIGIKSGPAAEYVDRVHAEDRYKVRAFVYNPSRHEMSPVEYRYYPPDGQMVWLEARSTEHAGPGGVRRIVGTTFDITQRKAIEEQVWRAANHDALTGLVNRTLFQKRLEDALLDARDGTRVNLLLVDLDEFKRVNDTLGHDAGDALLRQAADRLRALTCEGDTVARLGGDEFAVVMPQASLDEAVVLAERIVSELARPFVFNDRLPMTRASVGIASYPDHDQDPAELMKDADMALYGAKEHGRNRVSVYSPAMRAEMEHRVQVSTAIREALEREEIVPFYQPKVCLTTGRVVGFEALARWRHPTRGILTPGSFGSAFEDHELAARIGMVMLHQVAADVHGWLQQGLYFGRVAVNLSAAEVNNPALVDDVLKVLSMQGVPSRYLEIEVTESVLLGRATEQVGMILEEFHRRGVTIALDDFGTGYASLSHLKQFPVDLIKIDRSFVRDLERDPEDAAIVTAVIGLGKSLDIQVCAEGVETAGQVEYLCTHGCDQAQGYLFAKPIVGSRVPWLLTEAPALAAALGEPVLRKETA
jgi:diguanylate cyclase (GGDEF)-like protein/PAS domain S-box-containing protein